MSVSEQDFASTTQTLYLPNEPQANKVSLAYKLYAIAAIAVTLAWNAFLLYSAWRFVVWATAN